AVQTTFCLVNFVPFQPLQARICQLAVFGPVSVPALTYRVSPCETRPPTNCGVAASFTPLPFFSTKTPPFGGPLESAPPSPSNIWPPRNANDVGVCSPDATSVAVPPPATFGGGGAPAACAI